ncbi:LAMI_0H06942g1_1 [Lachancea mirantina]|uniref:2-hydroxyacyl-CoA lyase n=1 Tax=Lachancea mirantina TaxID=1230905 RepID=A0A1G4KFS3_9SACH|nr:LAMI_0H06942g1_1 [Lachancea mirantina]
MISSGWARGELNPACMVDHPRQTTISFPRYLTRLLKEYDVDTVFGIVGIPIVEIADAFIADGGIKFIGFRNEQAASYAASAYGYLTGKPGVLLVVGGPGVVHALAGIYNAMSNRWPLIVFAGSSEDQYKGGFQELDQVSLLKPYVKFAAKLNSRNIDSVIYEATRRSLLGSKGVSYVDIAGDLISEELEDKNPIAKAIPNIRYSPDPLVVDKVVRYLRQSLNKRILCVFGKGCVDASASLREFVTKFQIPFLPTPMAKGIIPDSHYLNVSSARSLALRTADVVLVFGARLNWILHFGETPKWKSDATFIQIDTSPEELGHNNIRGIDFALCGDIGLTVQALTKGLRGYRYSGLSKELESKVMLNERRLRDREEKSLSLKGRELNYNQVYALMRMHINDKDTVMVTEGANTMDVARISFPETHPRSKLDAGTNATMGVGLGYAIAAKIANPSKTVICIEGDSAFGFSAMELETASRYKLGIVFVVMNNSGIYHGVPHDSKGFLPSTALSVECRYDLLAQGLGCRGILINTLDELQDTFPQALKSSYEGISTVFNVIIEPGEQKKISFGWQNKPKL